MAVIKMKPTSPGRRAAVKVTRGHLYKGAAYAPLLEAQSQKAGDRKSTRLNSSHLR